MACKNYEQAATVLFEAWERSYKAHRKAGVPGGMDKWDVYPVVFEWIDERKITLREVMAIAKKNRHRSRRC